MTDAPEQPPGATESSWTHAPPIPHTEALELTQEHREDLRRHWPHQPPTAPVRSARYTTPHACGLVNGARSHARQVQHNTLDRGTDPPQFARPSQNIAVAAMLLRVLSEPNDPRERAIHRNLRALVETAAIQQAECSVSRHQLATSLPVRGTGMQQMGHYPLSPQQQLSVRHEAAAAPHLDPTTAPHQPPIYARLGPNRGTCSGDRSPSTDGPGTPTFA